MNLVYYVVVNNGAVDSPGPDWLVVQIFVDDAIDAVVVGRWDERTDATADADRWTALEEACAA